MEEDLAYHWNQSTSRNISNLNPTKISPQNSTFVLLELRDGFEDKEDGK